MSDPANLLTELLEIQRHTKLTFEERVPLAVERGRKRGVASFIRSTLMSSILGEEAAIAFRKSDWRKVLSGAAADTHQLSAGLTWEQ